MVLPHMPTQEASIDFGKTSRHHRVRRFRRRLSQMGHKSPHLKTRSGWLSALYKPPMHQGTRRVVAFMMRRSNLVERCFQARGASIVLPISVTIRYVSLHTRKSGNKGRWHGEGYRAPSLMRLSVERLAASAVVILVQPVYSALAAKR